MTSNAKAFSVVEKLEATHDTNAFDCGKAPLDRFLKRFALVGQKAENVRTYVVCRDRRVVGYYSLAVSAVEHAGAMKSRARRRSPAYHRVQRVLQPVAQGVQRQHHRDDAQNRQDHQPQGAEGTALAVREDPRPALRIPRPHAGPSSRIAAGSRQDRVTRPPVAMVTTSPVRNDACASPGTTSTGTGRP